MSGFNRKFYAQMMPLKFSEREDQSEGEEMKPHRVWNQAEANRYVEANPQLLQPLQAYIANASLTTIGPPEQKWDDYKGYCVRHPTMGGLLVAKVMFDYNALSYKYFTENSKAGICAVCGGLLVLPHHVVALCYWWPDGLEPSKVALKIFKMSSMRKNLQVTWEIKQAWESQEISVCWIHLHTDGVFCRDKVLDNIDPV